MVEIKSWIFCEFIQRIFQPRLYLLSTWEPKTRRVKGSHPSPPHPGTRFRLGPETHFSCKDRDPGLAFRKVIVTRDIPIEYPLKESVLFLQKKLLHSLHAQMVIGDHAECQDLLFKLCRPLVVLLIRDGKSPQALTCSDKGNEFLRKLGHPVIRIEFVLKVFNVR